MKPKEVEPGGDNKRECGEAGAQEPRSPSSGHRGCDSDHC